MALNLNPVIYGDVDYSENNFAQNVPGFFIESFEEI